MADESNHFLFLNSDCIEFSSVDSETQVFYDDGNSQIFVVKNNGAMVEVKGPDSRTSISFSIEDRGQIEAIKFSPTCAVLAIQRASSGIEYVNFANGSPTACYTGPKTKSNTVLGYYWTNASEIMLITEKSVELLIVFSDKRLVKAVKTFNISVNWAVYQQRSAVLAISTGSLGNIIQALQIRPSSFYKYPKFEIPVDAKYTRGQLGLSERDIVLANLYGKLCLLLLRHEYAEDTLSGAQIVVYTFQKEGPPHKTHILELELRGRFAISVVDNLVVVHHQTSQTSLVYDICLPCDRSESNVTFHSPIVPPYPIKEFVTGDFKTELYSMNWEIFQPNFIVDGTVGRLWTLEINLEPICKMISSPATLVDFLLLRRNSKNNLMKVCKEAIAGEMCTSGSNVIGTIAFIFNKLNRAYREHLDPKTEVRKVTSEERLKIIVDQCDMYSHVFSVFENEAETYSSHFAVAVIFEYINSLVQQQIPVQYSIYGLLINILVKSEQFFQLHQFLQYHVFTDSKPLACLLLSVQGQYAHAAQLALDMFKRLSVAQDDIVDIYLAQFDVLRALRYIQTYSDIDGVSARKFLEFAMNSGDNDLFYLLFKFFEERNLRLRGSAQFAQGEQCEVFVEHFKNLFGMSSALQSTSK
ncbi:hypothetical protein HDE_09955 [Halotydeus destructor]|nr:hypothetical protein HDE_09955 [Halotydeus destructor]